jgi:hypothetical protein
VIEQPRQREQPFERRRYQRFALRCKCWLEGEDASIYASTADVGLGGLFLRSAVPIAPGVSVEVELGSRDGRRSVLAGGVVTRTVPAAPGRRHGIGVEFSAIEGGLDALAALLQRAS